MTGLAADTDDLPATLLDSEDADDLQTGLTVGTDAITGTLKLVTGYTAFSETEAKQSGNYMALHASCDVDGATITAELVGGTDPDDPVQVENDDSFVFRITSTAQKVRFTAEADGWLPVSKEYKLTGLTLADS